MFYFWGGGFIYSRGREKENGEGKGIVYIDFLG